MYSTSLLRKINLEEALETAREEVLKKAKEEKRLIALNFKKMGITIESISQGTGISVEELRNL